jgi:hypothetical protein
MERLTKEQLVELREAVSRATSAGYMYDHEFLAVVRPASVQALLDENERLREALHAAGMEIVKLRLALGLNPMFIEEPAIHG